MKRKIYEQKKGNYSQYRLSIPNTIIDLLGIKGGDMMTIKIKNGWICYKKVESSENKVKGERK